MDHDEYTYHVLGSEPASIRIVYLQPAINIEAELRARIVHTQLDQKLPFEALSYTWGEDVKVDHIVIDDKKIPINCNLRAALLRLRQQYQERALWIDAICINQKDNGEKAVQVAMMDKIYSGAQRAVIWLDESVGDEKKIYTISLKLIEHFQAIGAPAIFNNDGSANWDALRRLPDMAIAMESSYTTKILAPEEIRIVSDLFRSPWYFRIWVLQEAALSRDPVILFGESDLPLQLLLDMASWISTSGQIGQLPARTQDAVKNLIMIVSMRSGAPNYRSNVETLVAMTRTRDATDPRDKIFGLLGMCYAVHNTSLRPNYEIDVETLYINMARHLIDNVPWTPYWAFAHLEHIDLTERSKTNLPSWVPDWRVKQEIIGLSSPANHHWADRSRQPSVRFHNPDPWISVTGKLVDTLKVAQALHIPAEQLDPHDLADGSFFEQSAQTVLEYLYHCLLLASEARDPSADGVPMSECLPFILIGDRSTTEPSARAPAECKIWLDVAQRIAGMAMYPDAQEGDAEELSEAERKHWGLFQVGLYSMVVGGKRSFALTEDGALGWVPCNARGGDRIVVFAGARTPHVIRSVGVGHFKILGECYVHGFMSGEAGKRNDIAWQEIILT